MFELSPLAAALQGLGYGSFLTAVQGLWAVTVVPAPLPLETQGAHAAFKPKRHARRVWIDPPRVAIAAPKKTPSDEELERIAAERRDLEALLLADVL